MTELEKAAQMALDLSTPTLREMVARHAAAIDPRATLDDMPEALEFQIEMARALLREFEALTQALAMEGREVDERAAAYFSYGEDSGYLEHDTAEAARTQAEADIKGYRSDAMRDNEWPVEADSVCWGVVLQKATAVDNSEEAEQESFDYKLSPAPQQATPERKGAPVAYFVAWPGDPVGMRRFYGADEWEASRKTVEYFGGVSRPLVFGDTSPHVPEDHPLMVFAIECEMGALQEHEVPLRARKALDAARKGE